MGILLSRSGRLDDDGFPNDVEVDVEVAVGDPVPHPFMLFQAIAGCSAAKSRYAFSSFVAATPMTNEFKMTAC